MDQQKLDRVDRLVRRALDEWSARASDPKRSVSPEVDGFLDRTVHTMQEVRSRFADSGRVQVTVQRLPLSIALYVSRSSPNALTAELAFIASMTGHTVRVATGVLRQVGSELGNGEEAVQDLLIANLGVDRVDGIIVDFLEKALR